MYTSTDTTVIEPINLEGIKAYLSLRQDDESEDSYLQSLVSTSRSLLEDYLDRVITARSFMTEMYYEGFYPLYPDVLTLDSVRYIKQDGAEAEIEDYDYATGPEGGVWIIRPNDILADSPVTVIYTSGYDTVPESVKLGIKMMSKTMYSRTDANPLTEDVRRLVSPERRCLM